MGSNWPVILAALAATISATTATIAVLRNMRQNRVYLELEVVVLEEDIQIRAHNRSAVTPARFSFTVGTPERGGGVVYLTPPAPGEYALTQFPHGAVEDGTHIEITWTSPDGRNHTARRWYKPIDPIWDPINSRNDQDQRGWLHRHMNPLRRLDRKAPGSSRLRRPTKKTLRDALLKREENLRDNERRLRRSSQNMHAPEHVHEDSDIQSSDDV